MSSTPRVFSHARIVYVIPLPAGWMIRDIDYHEQAIACLALVERWRSYHDGEQRPSVKAFDIRRALEPVTASENGHGLVPVDADSGATIFHTSACDG